MKKYFQAVAMLSGTIIGVGMFAVPFVVSKAGITLFLVYLPILGLIEYYLLKLYAEIILSTKKKHRTPGYASKYLGSGFKIYALISSTLGNYGAILAYIIIGGIFLHELFGNIFGGSILMYTTIIFLLESFIVLFGLKLISKVEMYMTTFLIFVVGIIVWKSGSYIDISNYSTTDWSLMFLPYGPIFFAVGGGSAVPEVCRLLKNNKKKIKDALALGVLIPILIMLMFVIAVVGVTGNATSPDTLVGLNAILGDELVRIALVFGVLAIFTSFLTIAQAQREIFWWDLKLDKTFSWVLACGVPYVLFIIGIQNLTKVVSLTGAISGGLTGILLVVVAYQVKKKAEQKSIIQNTINLPIVFALSILFLSGLAYELWAVFYSGMV